MNTRGQHGGDDAEGLRQVATKGVARQRPTVRGAARASQANAASRRPQVLALRTRGLTFRQIGEALGVSHTQAEKDYGHALASVQALTAELIARERHLSVARCEWMLERLAPSIDSGDPKAILTAVRIEQRRAALLGLDAPRQIDVAGPMGHPAVNIIVNAAVDEWPDPPQEAAPAPVPRSPGRTSRPLVD